MRTVIFCRVSSKEQEEAGYSLPAQEKYLREYAEKEGLEVVKVFAVSESASGVMQRKVFNEMITYIKKKDIFGVIVETTDRLTRNFVDVPIIDKWIHEDSNHQIRLAKEGCVLHRDSRSHEWFMWRVKCATAEYYVKLLSENVKKGQKEKIAQGWMPTKAPPGYISVGEKGRKIHVIDEKKAPLVRRMFELYATGEISLSKLTEMMSQEGLRGYTGNKLVKSRIHQLLSDPFYIGKIRWNKNVHQGQHEALLSEEVFTKVNSVLKSKTTPKYRKHHFLFQGIVKCVGCEGRITWEIQKGIVYGHCNHYRDCKQQAWAKEKEVEEQIVDALDGLQIKNVRLIDWIRKSLKEAHKEEINYNNTAITELNRNLERIQKRMDNLYKDRLDEVISKAKYDTLFTEFSEEKNQLVTSIKQHSQSSTKYQELGSNLYELSQKAQELYLKGNRDERRKLITLVFENLALDEGKLVFNFTAPFSLLSELAVEVKSSKVKKQAVLTAKIFEQEKKIDITAESDLLYRHRPILLRD